MTPPDLPETLRRAEQCEKTNYYEMVTIIRDLVACVTALQEQIEELQAKPDVAHRLHRAAETLRLEAELTKLREERDRLQERCDVLEPGARNYNQMRLRADAAERRVQALEAALMAAREAFDAHDHWCGYNPQAPGDPSFRRAAFLIDAALTAADPATTQA